MVTTTDSLSSVPQAGIPNNPHPERMADSQARSTSFVKFDDKQATVFVNCRHIVRLEYHPATKRAHLQLSDGHHYYLSDETAMRVINQLQDTQ
ncbi:MAG: hypothetical protein MI757_13935 [Pirellulales bacterium]|nr:hypothetical protein [Pirellulales bacterium]